MKMIKNTLFISGLLIATFAISSFQNNTAQHVAFQTNGRVISITGADFVKLEQTKNTVVIDVRTPGETAAGVIEGVDLFIDFNAPNFAAEVAKLDKSKTYVLYCRSGGRSAAASQVFVDKGFKTVYNLAGGITAWKGKIIKR